MIILLYKPPLHFKARLLHTHIGIYLEIVSIVYSTDNSVQHMGTRSFTIRHCNNISMLVLAPFKNNYGGVFTTIASRDLHRLSWPANKYLTPSPLARLRDIYYDFYKRRRSN